MGGGHSAAHTCFCIHIWTKAKCKRRGQHVHSCARARTHTRTHTGGLETVQPPCGAAPGQPEHAPSPACAFSRACAEMSMRHTRRNARADKGAYTQREPRQTAAGGGGGGGSRPHVRARGRSWPEAACPQAPPSPWVGARGPPAISSAQPPHLASLST